MTKRTLCKNIGKKSTFYTNSQKNYC